MGVFFKNMSREFKSYKKQTKITGTLPEDQYTFYIISLIVLLRMVNVSDKICTENQNINLCPINFFFENRLVYEIMLKNTVEPYRPQMTV
jgi:hypothetical protein